MSTTRQEILATPATPLPASARNVPAEELLAYAKRISKFTVPPTARRAPLAAEGEKEDAAAAEANASATPNGDAAEQQQDGEKGGDAGVALTALQPHESQWVNPELPPWFIPWPSDETIRRGGLAVLQAGGVEVDVPMGVDEEEEGGAREEEVEKKRSKGDEAEPAKTQAAAVEPARQQAVEEKKPAVFRGLDLYDPDDD